MPEGLEGSRAGLWLATGEAGRPRSQHRRWALYVPMSVVLVCSRARLPREVVGRWAGRDPSDNAPSPGKPVPACAGHSKIESGTGAAWEGNSGAWHSSVMLAPSGDLPASTEGGDREASTKREKGKWEETGHGGGYFYSLVQLHAFL